MTKPNIARMYDYWLGGTDNYDADRAAAEAVRAHRPDVAEQALDNKKFQTRAITYVALQGVRQFLDIGSGLPTSPARAENSAPLWLATHEAAQTIVPDAVVAYVDYDPVAVAHSGTLLTSGDSRVVATSGDMRDPAAILADPVIHGAGFSRDAPACVIMGCVLHFLDAATAQGVTAAFTQALAPGSHVIVSVGYGRGGSGAQFANTYNAQDGSRIYSHSWEEITAMLDGLDVVPPGLTDAAVWQAEQPEAALPDRETMILAAVARKP